MPSKKPYFTVKIKWGSGGECEKGLNKLFVFLLSPTGFALIGNCL